MTWTWTTVEQAHAAVAATSKRPGAVAPVAAPGLRRLRWGRLRQAAHPLHGPGEATSP